MALPAHLRTALDQLRRRRYNEGRKTARCAGEEYFCERVWVRRGVGEERECAVVCHEEQRIERAVAEDRCCCAYAECARLAFRVATACQRTLYT